MVYPYKEIQFSLYRENEGGVRGLVSTTDLSEPTQTILRESIKRVPGVEKTNISGQTRKSDGRNYLVYRVSGIFDDCEVFRCATKLKGMEVVCAGAPCLN